MFLKLFIMLLLCLSDCKDYDRHQAGARHTLHFNCAHCGMGAKTKYGQRYYIVITLKFVYTF